MTMHPSTANGSITRLHTFLLYTASALTYLLVTLGGIVCVTQSARGCPDWPTCYGQLIPPMQTDAIIEYVHRFTAALTSPFIIMAAIVGWRRARSLAWVSRPPVVSIIFLIAVVIFGALAVLRGIPPVAAAIDLGSALIVLALLLTASVVAFSVNRNSGLRGTPSFRSSYSKLTLRASGSVFAVLVSGVLVAEAGSVTRCLGWPLYGVSLSPDPVQGAFQFARQLLGLAAAILVAAVLIQAWRTRREYLPTRRTTVLVTAIVIIHAVVGLLLRGDSSAVLLGIYVASATAVWAGMVALCIMAGLTPATVADQQPGAVQQPARAV